MEILKPHFSVEEQRIKEYSKLEESLPVNDKGLRRNREQRRKFSSEMRYNLGQFQRLENRFIKELFEESDKSYMDIFSKYAWEWGAKIKKMTKKGKFKMTSPNWNYFEKWFAPIEVAVKGQEL